MPSATENRILPSPLFLMATVLVFGLAFVLSRLSLYSVYPELAVGITYDLALTAPILYFLAIRKTRVPKLTVVVVAGLGILTATFLLPSNQQSHLQLITTWVLPLAEICILGLAGYKTWQAMRTFRRQKNKNSDVHVVLDSVFDEFLGRSILTRAAAFEASVIYYAFLKWRSPEKTQDTFSYHKKRGLGALYAVFGFVIAAETLVIHILVSRWSIIAAWILTVSSLYVVMLLLAHYKASYLRPLVITDHALLVRCGLFCDAEIALESIEKVEGAAQFSSLADDTKQAALMKGFEQVNVLITTDEEFEAAGPYGIKRSFRKIALFADDQERLVRLLEEYEC